MTRGFFRPCCLRPRDGCAAPSRMQNPLAKDGYDPPINNNPCYLTVPVVKRWDRAYIERPVSSGRRCGSLATARPTGLAGDPSYNVEQCGRRLLASDIMNTPDLPELRCEVEAVPHNGSVFPACCFPNGRYHPYRPDWEILTVPTLREERHDPCYISWHAIRSPDFVWSCP